MKKILITGCAGFIGFHLCKKLISDNYSITGLDNINSYYDVKIKEDRLKELNRLSVENNVSWGFFKGNLEDKKLIEQIFTEQKPEVVVNLAAQAGVRYSLINPYSYINSNINGFLNILEACRNYDVKNLIYASSSSVYGGNSKLPFSEEDRVDHPISLYAATKKANELLAYSYSHLYKIPSIGVRFFTVYGPWGRPDMAPLIFTKSIIEKKPIQIFNNGEMSRDFTFIDDVIEILFRLINKPASNNTFLNSTDINLSIDKCPHLLFNIGNSNSISLMKFITLIEDELNIKAIKEYKGMQKGDVKDTYADIKRIENYTGFKPKTNIEVGIKKLIEWYKNYY